MNAKLEEFLTKLGKLTEEYGIEISGCGCCGSPSVTQELSAKKSLYHSDLEFNETTKSYEVFEDKIEF